MQCRRSNRKISALPRPSPSSRGRGSKTHRPNPMRRSCDNTPQPREDVSSCRRVLGTAFITHSSAQPSTGGGGGHAQSRPSVALQIFARGSVHHDGPGRNHMNWQTNTRSLKCSYRARINRGYTKMSRNTQKSKQVWK